jgi:hypothetical protein
MSDAIASRWWLAALEDPGAALAGAPGPAWPTELLSALRAGTLDEAAAGALLHRLSTADGPLRAVALVAGSLAGSRRCHLELESWAAGPQAAELPLPLRGLLGVAVATQAAGGAIERHRTVAESALALLDPTAGLARRCAEDLALHLALRGRLADSPVLAAWEPAPLAPAAFIDAVERGRVEDAARLLAELDAVGGPGERFVELVEAYEDVRVMLAWVLAGRGGSPEPEVLADADVACLDALHRRDLVAVHRAVEAADYAEVVAPSSLLGWRSLRLVLAHCDQELARQLLQRRCAAAADGYLDDLLRARIALLDGDDDAARRHFAAVMTACSRHGALRRLDAELRLALDLGPLAIVALASPGRLPSGGTTRIFRKGGAR